METKYELNCKINNEEQIAETNLENVTNIT